MKKVFLKVLLATCIVALGSPALAGFINGGFETGDFTGWTLDDGRVTGGGAIDWNKTGNDSPAPPVSAVIGPGALQPGQTTVINPYYDGYMARINDVYGGYHATKLSQTGTITAKDITDGAKLYVRWGAALVEPSNAKEHETNNFPFFGVSVTIGGNLPTTFTADASDLTIFTKIGDQFGNPPPPNTDMGNIYYRTDVWQFDLSGYAEGTSMKIELFAADCGLSGHGGFAFLDGIGTVQPPPPSVPEPGTLLLVGLGLVGVAGIKRRFRS